jgi:hypothetical protein
MQNGAVPFARVVFDYQALVDACSARAMDLQISRAEIDRVAGLADGHAGKLLSGRPVKTLGMRSLGDILATLGLIIMVVEDPAAAARTLAIRKPVDTRNQRFGRIDPKRKIPQVDDRSLAVESIAPASPEPATVHSHLRVVQGRGAGCRF